MSDLSRSDLREATDAVPVRISDGTNFVARDADGGLLVHVTNPGGGSGGGDGAIVDGVSSSIKATVAANPGDSNIKELAVRDRDVITGIGATNESAAASDSATSGLNGLFKRMLAKLTGDLGLAGDAAATSDTGSASLIALMKRYLSRGDKNIAFGPPAGFVVSGNIGMGTANIWIIQKSYEVPSGKVVYPLSMEAASATAGYITAFKRRRKLGTLVLGGSFTAGTSTVVGSAFEILYAEVTATLSAGTSTVNVTYTDQDGNTGAVTANATMSSTAIGTRNYFTFAAGDIGAIAVTGATRASGTATGTIDIYGETTVVWARHGTANVLSDIRFHHPENFQIVEGEQMTIEMQATATTATQRDCYVKYAMRDVP